MHIVSTLEGILTTLRLPLEGDPAELLTDRHLLHLLVYFSAVFCALSLYDTPRSG